MFHFFKKGGCSKGQFLEHGNCKEGLIDTTSIRSYVKVLNVDCTLVGSLRHVSSLAFVAPASMPHLVPPRALHLRVFNQSTARGKTFHDFSCFKINKLHTEHWQNRLHRQHISAPPWFQV